MIDATITGDHQVVARLQALPQKLREALAQEIQRQLYRIQAAVVTQKLSGSPLRRRTGNLASSINVRMTQSETEVSGQVGTKVQYGKVHEYGGTFRIAEHERKVLSRLKGAHTVTVRAHDAKYPQRSFLRSTLEEMRSSAIEAMQGAVARASQES